MCSGVRSEVHDAAFATILICLRCLFYPVIVTTDQLTLDLGKLHYLHLKHGNISYVLSISSVCYSPPKGHCSSIWNVDTFKYFPPQNTFEEQQQQQQRLLHFLEVHTHPVDAHTIF